MIYSLWLMAVCLGIRVLDPLGYYSTEHPRRAAVLNYFADGVISNTDSPMLFPKEDQRFHAAANIPKASFHLF